MGDTNYVEYADNALRFLDIGEDFTEHTVDAADVWMLWIVAAALLFMGIMTIAGILWLTPRLVNRGGV